ncbi:MAG TPA: PQQ-dependent sugar dehydrogenase [Thermoleophilaceae bacterium]
MLLPRLVLACVLAAGLLTGGCGSGKSNKQTVTSAPNPAPAPTSTDSRNAAPSRRGVRLVRVGNFDQPVYVTSPPGDTSRLFVVEQAGRIRVVRNGRKLSQPFLDIRSQVDCCGERGLLSMAFPLNYATSKLFYVYFTDKAGDIRVVQFRASSSDRADAVSARQILFQEHSEFANHNGGQLQFGPDGDLYLGLGDGGSEGDPNNHAQDLGSQLGKLLRVRPRTSGGHTVPRDNPFVGRAGAAPEVYAYGLRNPWRFSFDRRTGDLVIGDVGQSEIEEIDFARRGRAKGMNYGWSRFEGTRRNSDRTAPGARRPVLQHSHAQGFCSIIGGYVVRDRSLSLYGRYVYGDLCDPDIWSVKLISSVRASADRRTGLRVPNLSSFGEDAHGHVYLASLAGPVYRLASR